MTKTIKDGGGGSGDNQRRGGRQFSSTFLEAPYAAAASKWSDGHKKDGGLEKPL